ncbi:adenine-specific methyltransferase EcoRI family protein [Anaerovibrio sp. RM50]|uniref:adenine-specific methyltransferase EcoRI family protein n=1 Tax=Anaerovibrio sp. RM50 TaxID=1200557 RepID=UPI000489880C|nr:adenine-specific methyltransferase EcoRI family protein [Anaerovibrio sp. RM50]
MARQKFLLGAKAASKDEFYTQLADIERELRYYRKHFKDKTVFCNCDDPFESNFFKYFVLNFNKLGLKKLICTCYTGSPIANSQLSLFDVVDTEDGNKPYKAIITTVYDKTGDGALDMEDIKELFKSGENKLTELEGNGDFASPECLKLMDESDIVVTNPPFSLFRKYVATLMKHKKQFLIIGNINAITYKEIFPLIMNDEIWLGNGMGRWISGFIVPASYELYGTEASINEKGERIVATNNCLWLTNLDFNKRHEEMILAKRYNSEDYPKYDNYDAIEVSKTADIPCDFKGAMGVPITFLGKYSPDQFEIIGADYSLAGPININGKNKPNPQRFYINGVRKYARIVIRNKHPEPAKEH